MWQFLSANVASVFPQPPKTAMMAVVGVESAGQLGSLISSGFSSLGEVTLGERGGMYVNPGLMVQLFGVPSWFFSCWLHAGSSPVSTGLGMIIDGSIEEHLQLWRRVLSPHYFTTLAAIVKSLQDPICDITLQRLYA